MAIETHQETSAERSIFSFLLHSLCSSTSFWSHDSKSICYLDCLDILSLVVEEVFYQRNKGQQRNKLYNFHGDLCSSDSDINILYKKVRHKPIYGVGKDVLCHNGQIVTVTLDVSTILKFSLNRQNEQRIGLQNCQYRQIKFLCRSFPILTLQELGGSGRRLFLSMLQHLPKGIFYDPGIS